MTRRGPEFSERRRTSFDAVADDYQRYRSRYPRDVIARIIASAQLGEGRRVLEIGCGTGQLSVPLAEHGVELVSIDIGPNLAAFARANLAIFPRARVEVAAFEDWPLPPEPFDAVVSANAFHWIDPEVRFSKTARALKPGGFLVITNVQHVAGGTPGFFEDTQPYYRAWGVSDDPDFRLPAAATAPVSYPELDERAEFGHVQRARVEIARAYTTESFVGWLRTDSLISTLDPGSRDGFLGDIGELIGSKYGGTVTRNWVYEVITAQKVPSFDTAT